MVTSHPVEGIGGEDFVGGGVSALLMGDGVFIWPRDRSSTVRFLWPIKKQTQDQSSITTTTWKLLAFVLCRMGPRGCYQPNRKSVIQV